MNVIEKLFNIVNHNLATINGTMDYDRITEAIIKLCEVIENTDTNESIWSIGEYGLFTLDELLVGAYWHYTEWHGGQWSIGYRALCAIGRIFDPGMTTMESERMEGSSSCDAYELFNALAEKELSK